jgi:hypothetical protein
MLPNLHELEPIAKRILLENKVERGFDTRPAVIVAHELGYLPLQATVEVEIDSQPLVIEV